MPVFFQESDYSLYLSLLAEHADDEGVVFWAYCLMPNHVHFVAVPEETDSFARTFREAHRRYTRLINKREGWSGHLWQDRYRSFPMDEAYTLVAARYIENNPVEAGLCANAEDYRWSSAKAHLGLQPNDPLVRRGTLDELVPDWKGFLHAPYDFARDERTILEHLRSGRALNCQTGTE